MLNDNKFLRGVILGLLIYLIVTEVLYCKMRNLAEESQVNVEKAISQIDTALIIINDLKQIINEAD